MMCLDELCEWFEMNSDSELYSLQELHDKMSKNTTQAFSLKSFREKLKERYKDNIFFGANKGRNGGLVCFKNMADYHLRSLKKRIKKVLSQLLQNLLRRTLNSCIILRKVTR